MPPAVIAAATPAPVRKLRRTLDAADLNPIANHPEVRPWLGCRELGSADGPLDLTDLVSNAGNFALVADGGGFLLVQHEPCVYEVHSMFTPEARGGSAAEAMREGLAYMFLQTDCETILTRIPDGNLAAAGLARKAGFRSIFRREGCWNGAGVDFLSLSLLDWACGLKELEEQGEWFHNRLEAAKWAQGSTLPKHDDDPAHERVVGAAVLMMKRGNIAKAVRFYNRWAVHAGYAAIAVVQGAPAVLDVGDAVIEIRGDDMEILQCR